jgi:2-keto-3-deoxy-L-rhamnonate aldolase RhmA
MRTNPVRERLTSGGSAIGIMATEFFTPGFCQIVANAGVEFVMFDMEHGGVGIDTIKAQIAFARGVGIAPFVRPPSLAYHLIAPLLDAGAMGVMAPMIETREQAEQLASWCRYRPEGTRGVGFGVAHDDYQRADVIEGMRLENQRTLVIALIETATGIANADAILSVPGIDVGWLGHYDLTNSMGITAEFDRPEFHAAVDAWLGACRRHGKAAGILAATVAAAREWRAKGVRALLCGSDVGVFQTALGATRSALASEVGAD